jgi:hypothetical protein
MLSTGSFVLKIEATRQGETTWMFHWTSFAPFTLQFIVELNPSN